MITENMHHLNEISCDNPVTRIVISDDEVMSVNPKSKWEVSRIFTDYEIGNHKELIVVFKRKEGNNV